MCKVDHKNNIMGLSSMKVEFVSLWQISNKLFDRVKKIVNCFTGIY